MFPKTAKNQEHVLLSHPIKYTFWSYDPCRDCRLSNDKISDFDPNCSCSNLLYRICLNSPNEHKAK